METPRKIGSGVRNRALRDPDNQDPVHDGFYRELGPVNGKGGTNLSGPYRPVVGWPVPIHPGEWKHGAGRGVYVESPDRVLVVFAGEVPIYEHKGVWGHDTFRDLRFVDVNGRLAEQHRHCHEIVVFDRSGALIESWDHWLDVIHANDVRDNRLKSGHTNRVRVNGNDPDRHVWIVGAANSGIFKLTNDGARLVLKIDAEAVPEELHPFVYVQDMAFLPNGDLWIAHLHHLMRFSADGTFQYAVGGQGMGPGQFDGIHGLEVHPETLNLYVNDRNNRRVQVLDSDGGFLDEWPGIEAVYAIRLTADGQFLWAADGFTNKFLKYDVTGRLVPSATWGTFGIAPGAMWGPHDFDTDAEGNLYLVEAYSGRVQKLRLRDGTDPADPQIIGPLSR